MGKRRGEERKGEGKRGGRGGEALAVEPSTFQLVPTPLNPRIPELIYLL